MCHSLRLHHQDLHHGAERVRHQVSADDEALEDLMNDALAHFRQVLVHLIGGIVGSRIRGLASVEDLPL